MINLALLLAVLALPPAPASYVTDHANLLDDAREHALNERLAQYERDTSNQLMVYVDRRLPEGTTIEELSTAAFNAWGVGQEGKNNGVILFLFIEDRRSRIEVGTGLGHVLTDERAKQILMEMRGPLREAWYTTAVEQGVERIIATLTSPPAPAPQPVAAPFPRTVPEPRPAERSRLWSVIDVMIPLFVGAGILAFIVLALRHGGFEFSSFPTSARTNDPWRRSDHAWPSATDSSFSSHDSSPPSSESSSSSSSSDFTGDGGSSRGSGASDQW